MISVVGAITRAIAGRMELPSHTCLFYRKDGYSVGAVELDLILSENHSKEAEVTENPLQDGRAVSDGIYLRLREGTLTGLVSNHSLKHTEQLSEQTSEAIMDLADAKPLKNRAAETWEELKATMDRRELVTIVTALEVYENVAITRISAPRDGDSGDAQEFEISFKQVETVKLREEQVSAQVQPKDMDSDINRSSAVNMNNGQQVAGQPTEEEKQQLILGVQ